MGGVVQQGGSRRAWGAPRAPKPAVEQRRELETQAPTPTLQQPAAQHPPEPHPQPRAKHVLPQLGSSAGLSPRSSHSQQRRGMIPGMGPGAHRLKQQLAAMHSAASDGSAPTSERIPAQHGAAWVAPEAAAPPPQPSASPEILPQLPSGGRLCGEEEDMVLIASAAPSFSMPVPPAVQQAPPAHCLLDTDAPDSLDSLATGGDSKFPQQPQQQQQQQQQHSRRTSMLSSPLGGEDLSLTALAVASRASTRYSSNHSVLASDLADGAGLAPNGGYGQPPPESLRPPLHEQERARQLGNRAGAPAAALPPLSSSTAPPAAGVPQAPSPGDAAEQQGQLAARLSTADLAVLRQSLAELQISGDPVPGSGDEIPDQLVLQALSSRLGRLDSQKRRVLLAVLAKIEGVDGQGFGTAGRGSSQLSEASAAASLDEGGAAAAASQLIADSLHASRRTSAVHGEASAASGLVSGSGTAAAAESSVSAAASVQPAVAAKQPSQQPQHHGSEAPAVDGSTTAAAGAQSPSKATKLAALRSRSSSFAGKHSAPAGDSAEAAAEAGKATASRAASSLQQGQQTQQAQQQQQFVHPGPASHVQTGTNQGPAASKLLPVSHVRHREHPRQSSDGVRGLHNARNSVLLQRRSRLSPSASVASSSAGDALAAFAAEHNVLPAHEASLLSHAEGSLLGSTDALAGMAGAEGDCLELLVQPSELDLVTAGGAAAGDVAPAQQPQRTQRAATLPVLAPANPAPPRLSAAAAPSKASPEACAAGLAERHSSTALAGSSRGSTASVSAASPGAGTAAPRPGSAALLHCSELTFVVLETWGDSHFVGLTGLQLLGGDGQALPLAASQLAADPPDLNCFPGHSGDVRTVDKLLDGVNNTMDDTHMWLAPVKRQLSASAAAAASHRASMTHGPSVASSSASLPEAVQQYNVLAVRLPAGGAWLSGLRVWNYNKSPVDTARGVKRMLVLADGAEVSPPGGVLLRRAPGTAAFNFGQLIPLNPCWVVAAAAAANAGSGSSRAAGAPRQSRRSTLQTAGRAGTASQAQHAQHAAQQLAVHSESVAWVCNLPDPAAALDYLQRAALLAKATPGGGLVCQPGENFATVLPCGFSLRLVLISSWGCFHYVGLCGLEVRDAVRGPLRIRPNQVFAAPGSVAALPGMAADVRTPDKLVDGNNSGAAQHSWLAPLDAQEGNCLHVVLDAPVLLGALRVWNYAKTPARGVQQVEVYLDESLVWKLQGLLQRAPAELAPGQDFSQTLCFSEDAMAEAAATARRRVAASARAKPGRSGAGAGAASLPGDPLGVEGVEEWCQTQERVVLVNEGEFVAFPPDSSAGPIEARPVTSVVG